MSLNSYYTSLRFVRSVSFRTEVGATRNSLVRNLGMSKVLRSVEHEPLPLEFSFVLQWYFFTVLVDPEMFHILISRWA